MDELIELLIEAADELESTAAMMEPYYVQSGADRDAHRLVNKIKEHPLVIAHIQKIKNQEREAKMARCPICGKLLQDQRGVRQHMKDVHA